MKPTLRLLRFLARCRSAACLAAVSALTASCANDNGTSKLDPAAVAIAGQVIDLGAKEYARQHPVRPEK